MKRLSIDSVILFALVVPFIMTYRLTAGDPSYLLFGFIFLSLLFYLVLDVLQINLEFYFKLKQIVLLLIIILVLGSSFTSAIIVRHQTAPIYGVHDIILQQEAATRFFLDGKNPYATTYFGTFLEEWHYSDTEVNPALYHFVMEPFYLLFYLPFYWVANHTIGYPDGRMPLFFLFFTLLIMGSALVKDKEKKLLFVILLAFNPAMLGYILEGRSDIFMFTFMFGGLYLLAKKRHVLSSIPMALAFAVKQSAWPILPFYAAYIYFKTKNIKTVAYTLLLFALILGVIVGPFILWDAKAFLDSTVFYLSGNTQQSYPVSGYGFGKILTQAGLIKDIHSYYPFHIWQLVIGLPVVLVLLKFIRNRSSVGKLVLAYGIFLFVFWYFSRYFNNSHLGFLSLVFITAYFWPEKENKI